MGSITSKPWPPDPNNQPEVSMKRKLVVKDGKVTWKLERVVEQRTGGEKKSRT
jgi:hypothetical protein